ncbi:MAG: fumarylacetoacetate hydrolase, partial [Dehalococcoidia bacterium]|nr:fumarylacetoacetate hydrolase [Dehalococcoidia bacterium]
MKLAFFDDFKLGVVKDDTVVDVSGAVSGIEHTSPQDLINKVIENFSQHRAALQQAADSGQGKPVSEVRLRSPLPKPPNIICMAVNYMEDGTRDEPAPINAFQKSPNAVIGNGDTMILPDIPASIFEGEAEIALVIGKKAKNVKQEDAYDYIFGYMN